MTNPTPRIAPIHALRDSVGPAMARELVAAKVPCPVLTTPDAAVADLRRRVGA
ncbi:MAG: hypothetical protein JNL71_00455 [Rhodospirillales bacterium]|nr:hypothetical protein [Rhodospirillales bacterium]